MAYNNVFPVNYQYYPQQYGQQLMTPPTIHAEIVQISGDDEANSFPVGTGQSQMMMKRDDSAIYIKTVFANGQSRLVRYVREEEKPQEKTADFVTHEELEKRLAEIMKGDKDE